MRVLIEVNKLISVNTAYGNRGGGKRFITKEASIEKSKLRASLRDAGLISGQLSKEEKWYKIDITYYLSHSYKNRDVDNFNKLVVDGITEFLGFDDSHLVSVKASKYLLAPASNKLSEFVEFNLQEVDYNEFILPRLELIERIKKAKNG